MIKRGVFLSDRPPFEDNDLFRFSRFPASAEAGVTPVHEKRVKYVLLITYTFKLTGWCDQETQFLPGDDLFQRRDVFAEIDDILQISCWQVDAFKDARKVVAVLDPNVNPLTFGSQLLLHQQGLDFGNGGRLRDRRDIE